MNSNLRHAQKELMKLKKADDIYGQELVNIVLDFTRPGNPPKRYPLTIIRCSKQLAKRICMTKTDIPEEEEY